MKIEWTREFTFNWFDKVVKFWFTTKIFVFFSLFTTRLLWLSSNDRKNVSQFLWPKYGFTCKFYQKKKMISNFLFLIKCMSVELTKHEVRNVQFYGSEWKFTAKTKRVGFIALQRDRSRRRERPRRGAARRISAPIEREKRQKAKCINNLPSTWAATMGMGSDQVRIALNSKTRKRNYLWARSRAQLKYSSWQLFVIT